MRRPAPLAALLLLALGAAPAVARADEPHRWQLSADLFGETVGEVRLSRLVRGGTETLTYRSELRVIRDAVRLRQKAFIESTFDRDGRLVRSTARRCSSPEGSDAAPTCGEWRTLGRLGAVTPALAAEVVLARRGGDGERCLDIVDEETGTRGEACAAVLDDGTGATLEGTKFGVPFKARVRDGRLVFFEAPAQGARFSETDGDIELSDADLFADPIPSRGDVARALRKGLLRARLEGDAEAIARVSQAKAPGQRVVESRHGTALVEVKRTRVPKGKAARRQLDAAALLVAQARGRHVDCQAATAWFLEKARGRGWTVRPAIGFAWVDGRFAFHAWAVVTTPGGAEVPVDPLLAQVPADVGHVQLADDAAQAGSVLVAFKRGVEVEVVDERADEIVGEGAAPATRGE